MLSVPMAHSSSQTATQCVSKVELTVSCENLLDMDVGSKSDPLCVLLNASGNQWFEVSRLLCKLFKCLCENEYLKIECIFVSQVNRTEKIKNCLNPKFAKKFVIDYYFEIVQKLRFAVYDIDNKTIDLSDDDFLGEFECSLGQVRQL